MTLTQTLLFCITRSCHNKCVSPRYAEPDLNKGESVCIDRCVAKFFEVNKKVRLCRVIISSASNAKLARLVKSYKALEMQQEVEVHLEWAVE